MSARASLIDRRGLRDHVYDAVLDIVLSGEIEPGARLGIDSLARELQVSPTPVREALVQLERTGLVTREALKGYRVAEPLEAGALDELFEARLMIECTAARLATPATGHLLTELREAQQRHEHWGALALAAGAAGHGSAETGDDAPAAVTTNYYLADTDFHRVVLANCGNRFLLEMSDGLGAQIHRMRQLLQHGVGDVEEALAEHAAIVAAFSSGDPQAPEQAMREHLEQVRARSLAIEQ